MSLIQQFCEEIQKRDIEALKDRMAIAARDAEIERLKAKVRDLEAGWKPFMKERDEMIEEAEELRERIAEDDRIHHINVDAANRVSEENETLRARVEELEGNLSKSGTAYWAMQGERDELRTQITTTGDELGQYKIGLSEACDERDELKARVEELEAKLGVSMRMTDEACDQRDALKARITKLQACYDDVFSRYRELLASYEKPATIVKQTWQNLFESGTAMQEYNCRADANKYYAMEKRLGVVSRIYYSDGKVVAVLEQVGETK